MPLDKLTMKIEVEDSKGRGTFIATCETTFAELNVYNGPLARITISNPVGPDAQYILSSDKFINEVMLEFAKAFWNVQELRVQ